jgi:ribonuclease HI
LLNSSYKIFTKILATRLQPVLAEIISPDQQGFVYRRRLHNSVNLMMAMLQKASNNPDIPLSESPLIVLLDFRKAYDTIDRHFLQLALLQFGFSARFTDLVMRLHYNTQAKFTVNGELSEPIPVDTGIRQGCPLAPLLFLICIEVLGHGFREHPQLRGIPQSPAQQRHLFSGFVDDSALYLQHAAMLQPALRFLHDFGAASGLVVQPAKSVAILLNTAYQLPSLRDIPLMPPHETTRYLGVQIGLSSPGRRNWSLLQAKIEKRLQLLRLTSSSFPHRIHILNTIILPAILFISQFHLPTPAELSAILHQYKKYLWPHASGERLRWKINQATLSQPRALGGLGLRDPRVAIRRQAILHAQHWLLASRDKYWHARHALTHANPQALGECCKPSPCSGRARAVSTSYGNSLQQLNQHYSQIFKLPTSLQELKHRFLQHPHQHILSFWANPFEGELKLQLSPAFNQLCNQLQLYPAEAQRMWPSFRWASNPLMTGHDGHPRHASQHPQIHIDRLYELQLVQRSPGIFRFRTPVGPNWRGTLAQVEALKNWIFFIVLNCPTITTQASKTPPTAITPLPHSPLPRGYYWLQDRPQLILGRSKCPHSDPTNYLLLHQDHPLHPARLLETGPHPQSNRHGQKLRHNPRPLYFQTTQFTPAPLLENRTSLQKLHRQPQPRRDDLAQHSLKISLTPPLLRPLHSLLQRLKQTSAPSSVESIAQQSTWHGLWQTRGGLYNHQEFFWYRLATRRLNLFHSHFPICPRCGAEKETLDHLLWTCAHAQATWKIFLQHWTGTQHTANDFLHYKPFIFSRTIPPFKTRHRFNLTALLGQHTLELEQTRGHLWWLLCSIAAAGLWYARNQHAFEGSTSTPQHHALQIFNSTISQLSSIAHRQATRHPTQTRDPRLRFLLQEFQHSNSPIPLGQPPPQPTSLLRLYYDGGARGNPGPGGSGWIVLRFFPRRKPPWKPIAAGWTYHPAPCSNNYAELSALTEGLEHVRQHVVLPVSLDIFGDSALVQGLLLSSYRSRHPGLHPRLQHVQGLLGAIPEVAIHHIRRHRNQTADFLANEAMNTQTQHLLSPTNLAQQHLQDLISADIESTTTQISTKPKLQQLLEVQIKRLSKRT